MQTDTCSLLPRARTGYLCAQGWAVGTSLQPLCVYLAALQAVRRGREEMMKTWTVYFEKTAVILFSRRACFNYSFLVWKALAFSFKPVISKCKIFSANARYSLGLVRTITNVPCPESNFSKRRHRAWHGHRICFKTNTWVSGATWHDRKWMKINMGKMILRSS